MKWSFLRFYDLYDLNIYLGQMKVEKNKKFYKIVLLGKIDIINYVPNYTLNIQVQFYKMIFMYS